MLSSLWSVISGRCYRLDEVQSCLGEQTVSLLTSLHGVVRMNRSCSRDPLWRAYLSWTSNCHILGSLISGKKRSSLSFPHLPSRYCDLGGISGILQEVRELIEYPLVHPEVYAHLGIEPVSFMRHFLLDLDSDRKHPAYLFHR